MVNQYHPRKVSPPGGTIEDIIEERELDAAQVASELSLSRHELDGLLRGELAINGDLAAKLHKTFGVEPDFWLAREHDYREWVNKQARLAG
jgi:HTH-type transcriptional regulator/antitoxin HigA